MADDKKKVITVVRTVNGIKIVKAPDIIYFPRPLPAA